ncbi:MAG: folylpolyglutamate synthase/dihydrofolate synthase family protein [Ginsengibacter sp.]
MIAVSCSSIMNYEQTLTYLFTRLPLFSKSGAIAYKKDIINTVLLCKEAGDPQQKIKTIHIAGTNGKGSTSHMLAAVFQEAGYKTGLYTSPHLKDFRERIKINGRMIPKNYVVDFVAKMKSTSERIQPSFFEFTVVLALKYFADEATDIAIIETGLGGRLDSTNVITPELSVITNIGFDHVNILGDTLEKIAFEKAGIIKKNVPVVIGETLSQTKSVFISKARECNSPIIFSEHEYQLMRSTLKNNTLEIEIENIKSTEQRSYVLDLTGIYQQYNLRTVLTCLDEINKSAFDIPDGVARHALSQVKKLTGFHGRWEIIHSSPLVVLDVAHNEDGIKQMLNQVTLYTYNQLNIVFGIVSDKDADKILSLFPKEARYYFTNAHIPRALPAGELLMKAQKHHLKGEKYEDVNMAIHTAIANASKDDLIIVCGSVFVVGEVNLETEKKLTG